MGGEPFDAVTFHTALEYFKQAKPGATHEWNSIPPGETNVFPTEMPSGGRFTELMNSFLDSAVLAAAVLGIVGASLAAGRGMLRLILRLMDRSVTKGR